MSLSRRPTSEGRCGAGHVRATNEDSILDATPIHLVADGMGGHNAGEIASAAYSPALGKVVALAYVRIPFSEPGSELTVDGTPARVAS